MKPVVSLIILGTAAAAIVGCSATETTYVPRAQTAYVPAQTTYYSTPVGTAAVTTAAPANTYYVAEPPNFQKSNVYSSRWDYYRNYQGSQHGGPERTGW
ncbi:hypothetical protein [Reyranella sp.]|uniref:hypothetical protein n=1 Tax=Reyranella sp. TaxID=1929291 RepID=UPI003BAA543D